MKKDILIDLDEKFSKSTINESIAVPGQVPDEVIARIDLVEKFSYGQYEVDQMTTTEVLQEYNTQLTSQINSLPDLDAILQEWSWRCDKGFPDYNSTNDRFKLQEVLDEMGIDLPFKRITEASDADKTAAIARMSAVMKKSGISQTAVEQMVAKLNSMTPEKVQTVAEKFQTLSVDEFFNGGWETFREFWPIKGEKTGTGRGELMAVMAIKGASSGGLGAKDLQLPDGTQWEIKEDPYSIRMAKSGFSGLFEYVDEMRTFYKYLIGLELNDRSKDTQLLINLKAAFNDDAIANKVFTLLKVNFRGDGFKATAQDTKDPKFVDTETFFERIKIAAELPASVIQRHYDAFLELKNLRKQLAKNSDLIKTAKMTVKTQDAESDYYISKQDAEELRTAKVDSEVSIHKGKAANNKDFRVFMFNLLKIFDHPYAMNPSNLVKGFQKQKDKYFGEVVGVLYYEEDKDKPYKGFTRDFIVFGISQGQGKLSLRSKYTGKGYTWIDNQQ